MGSQYVLCLLNFRLFFVRYLTDLIVGLTFSEHKNSSLLKNFVSAS